MNVLKSLFSIILLTVATNLMAQTPNNCLDYTSVGTTGSGTTADDCAVPGMVPGQAGAAWTGTGCNGFITSTVTGGPVSCLTLAYIAVNQNDFGTITTDTGGNLTITAINAAVNGNVVGPYSCGASFVGTVAITVCSDVPFNSVTLTNSGCTSGWVINCASQIGCGGGGGNAGADSTETTCGGTIDLDNLVTGDPGGTWNETTNPPSGQFNIGTGVFDAGAAGVGTYTFAYAQTGGCAGADTAIMTINVVAPASGTWNPPSGVCQNDAPIDLNTLVTGTAGGTWSGTGVTGNMFDPSVGTQTITYTVGTAPCDDVVAQQINVTPAMSPAWNSPGTVCEAAGTIDLNTLITGDPGGTWTGNGVSGNIFDPTGLSGPIQVTYTVGTSPCIGMSQQAITVEPDVDPSWTPPANLCDDMSPVDLNTTLSGTSGGTWSGTGVTGSMFDPSMGTQTITYTVGNGACVETSTQQINVGTAPDPSWTTVTMCASDAPINLNNQITGDPGGTWTGTGVSGNVFDPFFGSQTITYSVSQGACSAQLAQQITVLDPQISIAATHISCFGAADGSAVATVTGASGSESYLWNPSGQTSASATGLGPGQYQLTVTDGACITTDTITILEPLEITLSLASTPACQPALGTATVAASGGVGGFTYLWASGSQTTATAIDLDSAMHTVTVTDANGCSSTDSILVQAFPAPTVTTISDTTILYPNCIDLTTSGAVSYEWTSTDDDMSCYDCSTPAVCPIYATQYCVEGTDANGCKNSDCVLVEVEIICGEVFVPSAFSPNDDGNNDLECLYSDCIDYFTFTIYNRWGEKVFQTSDMNICWDGTWKGKPLNSAVFVYTLDGYLIDGQTIEQKGNISLIR